jgi:hypothetical protein
MTRVLDELGLTALVTSITGLSPVGVAAILAETGDPRRFATGRAVVKHAGLAPREKLSGAFTGRSRLTGQGRPGLRLAAWRAVWGAQRANPVYRAPLPAPDQPEGEQAHAYPGADRHRRRDPAAPARGHHHRAGLRSSHRDARHPAQQRGARRLTWPGGLSSWRPGRALRGIETSVISALIMGSPVRRLLNPITRCRDQPHNRYAGTDDGRGTGQSLTQTISR